MDSTSDFQTSSCIRITRKALLNPTPRVSVSVSLKWVWDFAFLRNAADQATTLWKPLDQATSEFLSSSVILILWVCNYKWNYYFPYANTRLKIFSETTVLSYEYNQQRIDSLIHSFKQDSGLGNFRFSCP